MDKKRKVEGPGGRVLGNERFPLRGLLTCPRCGRNLTASGAKGKSKTYYYYHCHYKCGFRFDSDKLNEHCSFFEKLGLIEESYISKEIYEVAEQINDSGYDIEVFESYVDCVGKMDFQNLYDGVVNYYMGEHSDDETFAQYMLEESIPESLPNYIYIDWESTARNLMFDYYSSDGYYFRA